jgi:cytosine permease
MSDGTSHSNDFEQSNVPAESRRGFWSMLVVMLGFTFFSASMFAGGRLGAGMTFQGFLLTVLAGNLILGAYTGILAYMAAKTGSSIHILSRYAFGEKGSYLPSAILAITQVGWFGVGIAMFAIPVQAFLVERGYSWAAGDKCLWTIVIISGACMSCTAYFGIKSLTVLSFIAVPLIIIFGMLSSGMALFGNGGEGFQKMINFVPDQGAAIGVTAAIAISIGSFISGGTCTPDFVRFSKNSKVAVWTTVIAFFLGNSLMFFFGAAGAMVYNKADIAEVLVIQGLLLPAILSLGLNIWTTNDNAIYTSGLGISNITKLPKRIAVLINGTVGTLAAIWLNNNFIGYLNFLNTIIPPVGAVLIADFFVRHNGFYKPVEQAKFCNVNFCAVAAWLAGSAVAFIPTGIAAINGMVCAGFVYIFLSMAVVFFKHHQDIA